MFELDELTFVGRGVASDAAPSAAIQADPTSGSIPLTVNFTGVASDPEGTELTYEWDFESDGTVDATTKDATHTYATVGAHTATLQGHRRGRALAHRHDQDRDVPGDLRLPR